MSTLDSVVLVSVTASTQTVTAQSFNIPLIIGNTRDPDGAKVTTYSQPSDLLVPNSGYLSSSGEYVYAQEMYSQAIQPGSFKVAKRSQDGSLTDDINAIIAQDDTWYGCVFVNLSPDEIAEAAKAIQATPKIAGFVSNDADVGQDTTADVLSQLQSKGYDRSYMLYYSPGANFGGEAGIMGGQLPKAPGSTTWHLKPIVGLTADALTPDVVNRVAGNMESGTQGKGGNVFVNVGGQSVFLPGQMVDGTFIDQRIGTDSLQSLVKTNILGLMVSVDKIPYTNAGCTLVENQIRAAINTHVGYGFIDGDRPITITHVDARKVPENMRAQRIAPPFTFECYTTGGIHAVRIIGQVNI